MKRREFLGALVAGGVVATAAPVLRKCLQLVPDKTPAQLQTELDATIEKIADNLREISSHPVLPPAENPVTLRGPGKLGGFDSADWFAMDHTREPTLGGRRFSQESSAETLRRKLREMTLRVGNDVTNFEVGQKFVLYPDFDLSHPSLTITAIDRVEGTITCAPPSTLGASDLLHGQRKLTRGARSQA
jgi:hypothetical protein